MGILNSIKHIIHHPLTQNAPIEAFKRVGAWQIGSRLLPGPIIMPYVNHTRLLISRGMTGATGSIYVGLHDFEQMSFLLHYLRADDLFIDVGANVGSYTVLASGAVGCRTIAFEPAPSEYSGLIANIRLNNIDSLVDAKQMAVGNKRGEVTLSEGQGPGSKIIADGEAGVRAPICTLDDTIDQSNIRLIKVDVEGFELDVLKGGQRVLAGSEPLVLIIELIGLAELEKGIDDKAIHSMILDWGFKTCRYRPFERDFAEVNTFSGSSNNMLYAKGIEAIQERVKSARPFGVLGRQV